MVCAVVVIFYLMWEGHQNVIPTFKAAEEEAPQWSTLQGLSPTAFCTELNQRAREMKYGR